MRFVAHYSTRAPLVALLLATFASASPALAQHEGHAMPHDTTVAMTMGAEESMSDGMAVGKHLRVTRLRNATTADSARARAIADTLRAAIAKYRDVKVAEADGYAQFAPRVKMPKVYHFTRRASALKAAFSFDPASPTSLLYTRDSAGKFTLVGAMYTAPRQLSEDKLNERIPLSIAQWHQHVNICVPKMREQDRWTERGPNGRLRFGPAGTIATEEDCATAGGRWRKQAFGWMVHANVMTSDDLGAIWKHEHGGEHMAH